MIKQTKHGICKVAVAPVRAAAADQSEIVTQLLFGDTVKIIEQGEPWIKIEFPFDDYTGWMDFKQLSFVSEDEFSRLHNKQAHLVTTDFLLINTKVGKMRLMLGSNLPSLNEGKGKFGEFEYQLIEQLPDFNESLTETAMRYLNAPYLWGGKGLLGIDCSGFTQMVAKLHGHQLPRDCSQQIEHGTTISFSDRKPGDFMYFINKNKHIHHIGILISDHEIIHASGQVRVDRYDELGIFREDMNKHTHDIHSIKRL